MSNNSIILYSNRFELSESEHEPDCLLGKWIICDFGPNKNDVQLDRGTILDWISTLVGKPLVGKVVTSKDGAKDFSSHNMKLVTKTDDYGNEYEDCEFDTSAFGSFIEVDIEEIDGVEHIVAKTKIWKRYPEACSVIKSRYESGSLASSWEIEILKQRTANYMGRKLRIIEKGSFIGHCALGEFVEPAYDSSRLLNVAAKETDVDLEKALISDIYSISQKEDKHLGDKKNNVAAEQEEFEATPELEDTPQETENEVDAPTPLEDAPAEPAATESSNTDSTPITVWDLRNKIENAYKDKTGTRCYIAWWYPEDRLCWVKSYCDAETELDYKVFTYSVEGDTVVIGEIKDAKLTVSISEINSTIAAKDAEIATRDTTILELNGRVNELSATVTDLAPFREKFEQAEAERVEAETAAKRDALKQSVITSKALSAEEVEGSDELLALISNLDEAGVNKFIVDKIISAASPKKPDKKPEASATTPIAAIASVVDIGDIDSSENEITYRDFVSAFIGG